MIPDEESRPLIVTGELAEQVNEIAGAGFSAEPMLITTAEGATAYVISDELAQFLAQAMREHVLQVAGREAIPVSLAELEELAGMPLSQASDSDLGADRSRDG
ncbi:hypothetical protein [Nonomuraea dietziae]|uniref:Uncharacterized protein n=1 Tax=Nonomuraea dietziae TaxID=65515 RepID=A0A7W5VB62_9ACTN|nr:hypothetical protein [Nonomuraea dietziae]MBB3734041.1 hypothetical protein [Nonomuraea dietziae]